MWAKCRVLTKDRVPRGLSSMYNFAKGEVANIQNANGCRFTFNKVDVVHLTVNKNTIDEPGVNEHVFGNHIVTQMVRDLWLYGRAERSFDKYTIDTRGVFGKVRLTCKHKNTCNNMVVIFQKAQDYGYENNKQRDGTKIVIECGEGSCGDLLLLQMD